MKKSPGAEQKPQKTSNPLPATPQPDSIGAWIDPLSGIWLKFGRFGWDILGVFLLAFALMTLLGLIGLTEGTFISPWVFFLTHWTGWGSYLMVVAVGLVGLFVVARHFSKMPAVPLGRILALEGLLFVTLALLSELGGHSLDRADAHVDGGLIGWGLAELLHLVMPAPLVIAIFVLLFFYFALTGMGLTRLITRQMEIWLKAEEQRPAAFPILGAEPASGMEAAPEVVKGLSKKDRRKPTMSSQGSAEPPAQRDDRLPPLDLLMNDQNAAPDEKSIQETGVLIEKTLVEFGVPAHVVGCRVGPTVTQYAVEPGFIDKIGPDGEPLRQKVRVSQISALARDLALRLSAERLRIEAPVPGYSFVGVEVPNQQISVVRLRSLLESDVMLKMSAPLMLALGRDVSGLPLTTDLGRMPHLLVAGTTGSGKSVCIAAIATCLMMNNTPQNLRIAMLDPKMVELVRFNGLPHLLGKVETELDRMLAVLRWAIAEMDARYRLLETARARDLETFNRRAIRRKEQTLPRIVIMIDELADLMMSAPEQTEAAVVRLAQLARATGIHLVLATQRPSTDVVTGLIKANFPARISFTVASSIDSRVILDTGGAESLLGRGDMLFLNPEVGTPVRAQGVMVTDPEIEQVIQFWQKMAPAESQASPWEDLLEHGEEGTDELVQKAIAVVRTTQRASASLLQRRLRIGYPRAARLMDELESLGIVGPGQPGGRDREVLVDREDGEDDSQDPAEES